jgi:O-antigen/teichoic acid export membrane protein
MKLTLDDIRHRLIPLLLAQGIGLACGIIGVRLASHWVPPGVYGHYGVFLSLTPIGMWVIFTGLNKFAARHWLESPDRAGLLREVLAAAVRRMPWLALAVAGLTFVASPGMPVLFGGILLLATAALGVSHFAQTTLQASRRHWADCSITASGAVSRALVPLLLYGFVSASFTALLGGFLLHTVLVAAMSVWWLRDSWKNPAAQRPRQLTATYAGPLFITLAIAGWVLGGMNRWVVAGLYGEETAGYFTLAGNIALILPSMLGSIMLQFVQPVWYAAYDESMASRNHLLRQADRIAFIYGGLAVAGILALHFLMPRLVGPLVSTRYAAATDMVLPAGFFAVAVTTGYFYHTLLLAVRREKACATSDLSGAACLVVGSLVSALAGWEWFIGWLVCTPLIPWLVVRPLARRAALRAG